jgi:hypothetical protein
MHTKHLVSGGLIAACLALTFVPRAAQACGGTFCDNGPQPMPVDQTGESILFWIDRSGAEPHTEAHIQIQYEGDAERFAWIIPVGEVPEVLVGSQALFDNMLTATVPTFSSSTIIVGDCDEPESVGCGGLRGIEPDEIDIAGEDGFGGETGGDGDGDGPQILDRGFAGAFEYVTLTGDNVQEVVDWLEQNGYAQDDEAPPILDEYLQEGFVFVAVKLQSGAGVDEIHPLAIRYPGVEPCIPIRLTRIAAVDDMAIRAFFLGESRVAPQNWPHVLINDSRLDWVNMPELSYPGLVGAAIDEAGGRAFVTEYAGTDDVVSTAGVFDARWDPADYEGIEPIDVVDVLEVQGLAECAGTECSFRHPQVEALLQIYLPAPDGVGEHEFWSCLSCFADQIDLVAWGAQPGFAAEFDERISGPAQHALAMLEDASQLTRLFTLLSPHEMIEDPLFHEADSLPSVDNLITVTRANDCEGGPSYYDLPDGRRVALTDQGFMPELEGNPAALRIEQVPMMGPPQVEVDNGPTIDALLKAWNDQQLDGPEPGCAIGRFGLPHLLGTLGLFGLAWVGRSRRRE